MGSAEGWAHDLPHKTGENEAGEFFSANAVQDVPEGGAPFLFNQRRPEDKQAEPGGEGDGGNQGRPGQEVEGQRNGRRDGFVHEEEGQEDDGDDEDVDELDCEQHI